MQNRFGFYNRIVWIISLTILFSSCGLYDELDKLSNIKTVSGNASISAALVSATLNVNDLLGSIEIGSNGITNVDGDKLGISYGFNFDYNIDPISFPDLPVGTAGLFTYPTAGTGKVYCTDVSSQLDLSSISPSMGSTSLSSDFKVYNMTFKAGASIKIQIPSNTFTSDAYIDIEFPTVTKDGSIYKQTDIPVNAGSTSEIELSNNLEGYTLSTSDGITIPVTMRVYMNNPSSDVSHLTESISLLPILSMGNYYSRLEGYFGNLSLPDIINSQTLTLNSGELTGSIIVDKAAFGISTDMNSWNIPLGLNLSESSLKYNTGTSSNLTASGTLFGNDNTQSLGCDISNIDLLNVSSIDLVGKVSLNPENNTSLHNVITDNGKITITATLVMPFSITTNNLKLTTTGTNNFKSSSTSTNITSLNVKLTTKWTNSLPLGVKVTIGFSNNPGGPFDKFLFDTPLEIPANSIDKTIEQEISQAKYDELKTYEYQSTEIAISSSGQLLSGQAVNVKVGLSGAVGFETQ